MENAHALKFFNKPKKAKMLGLVIVFLWIILWNVIYQVLHTHELTHFGGIEIINWSFFLSVTVFFMQEELSYRDRFLTTLFGGAVGLVIAAGVIKGVPLLMGAGLSKLVALSLLLIVSIALLILLQPIFPFLFNNVGFCYFIVSFVKSGEAVADLPSNLVSLALGCLILNLGCSVLLTLYKKHMMKKHAAKN
ncbi:MAG: hypothetical protein IK104_08680 [Clostridia bacterium]|nr:hypothetical protein [Clostridia bacterium]